MQDRELPEILRELRDSPDHRASFTETWTQGRSAFGGLSTALAVCGAAKLLQTAQSARSLMVSFIGPVPPGEVSVVPRIQRQGKNVTQMSSELLCGEDLCLQVMAVFGNTRESMRVAPDPGFAPAPRVAQRGFERNLARPSFLRYFEGCWSGGGIPFSGKPDLRLGIWARHISDMSEFPVEKLVALADIPPPIILSHYSKPGVPASSLTWSLEFVMEPESVDSDWFYLDYQVEHAANGYTQQSGKLFTESGELCALSRQCMVYFDNSARFTS
jgi:acyl-CoA thioesterase